MDTLFLIITTIIPKAGIQIGSIPLTLSTVLLFLVIIRNPNQTALSMQRIPNMGILYLILLLMGLVTFATGMIGLSPFDLAKILTVIFSPLAIVATTRVEPRVMMKIVCIALLIINFYAFLQFAFSVTTTQIPGITNTYGQNMMLKNNGMNAEGFATKTPSTYQSGGALGIFNVLGLCLMLIWQITDSKWKVVRIIAMICALGGIMICGSRSIILPFAAICLIIFIQHAKTWPARLRKTYLFWTIIAGILIVLYLLVFQQDVIQSFVDRNIIHTLSDPTGSSRTIQWSDSWEIMHHLSFYQLMQVFLIGNGMLYGLGGEGLPKFFMEFGIISTISFYGMLLTALTYFWSFRSTRVISLGIFCVIFAFCIDQSFNYPPNVIEVFLVIGIALSYESKRQISMIDDIHMPLKKIGLHNVIK